MLGEKTMIDTLCRLKTEGLSRHDAVHALESVLAEHLYDLAPGMLPKTDPRLHGRYSARLKALTAQGWRAG